MNRIAIFLALFITANIASAQSWKYMRNEIYFGLGASNFLGELGGADQIGTDGIKDLEFKMTRPSVTVGYRYTQSPMAALRIAFTYGRLNGDDALTEEFFRQNRNLHFRAPIYELTFGFEFYPFGERSHSAYRMRGVKGNKNHYISPYFFTGFGGLLFNPQAEYNGKWVDLQPLSTEGQGLPGGPNEYKKYTFCIPMGGGIKYSLSRELTLGLELSMRMTFTDYLDDVSGVYYDNDALRAAKGDMAADLANPALDPNYGPGDGILTTGTGQQRGDSSDNDSYMFAMITIHYKLLKGRLHLPKF